MLKTILTLSAVTLVLGMAGSALAVTAIVETMDEIIFFPGAGSTGNAGNGNAATINANRGGGAVHDIASSLGRFNLPTYPALSDGTMTITIYENAVGPNLADATLDVRHLSYDNHNYDTGDGTATGASRSMFEHSTGTQWNGANNSLFDGTVSLGSYTLTSADHDAISGGGTVAAVFTVPKDELNEAIVNRSGIFSLALTCDQCEGPRGASGDPTSSGQTHGFAAYGTGGAAPATLAYNIPEPASLTLLGLGGLLMVRRKR